MRSIRYSSHPRECDELMDVLTEDYEFIADEYPTAWKFRQFLKTLQLCDFSEILDDNYFITDENFDPIIMCNRIIFFSCRPRDMERLCHVLEHLGKEARIYSGEGDLIYARNDNF